jgi:hypothetical protein
MNPSSIGKNYLLSSKLKGTITASRLRRFKMLAEAHKQALQSKYGLPEQRIKTLEEAGELSSLLPQEVRDSLGRTDIDSTGLLIRYPGNGAATIRLDDPPILDGKPQKYLRRAGEPNSIYNPGVDIAQTQDLWIAEGELKAQCGHAWGLPIIGLSGIWNWKTIGPEVELLAEEDKLSDEESLLPELAIDWSGKKVALLYDSDIIPGHRAYDAFPRFAEQLYRLGAAEVKILSLPSISKDQKTGLDEFIIARGPEQALRDLQAMRSRKESYLPTRAGALTYAERRIKSEDLEDKLKATIAHLGAKGKAITSDWITKQGLKGEIRTALLQDAKERLSQVQAKPTPTHEDLPELGPEYARVKALIQPFLEDYDIDKLGRIAKVEWKEGKTKDGQPVLIRLTKNISNFAAWPLREILKDSGNGRPERYIELQGLLQGGIPLQPAKIGLSDFLEKNSWTGQLWGAKAGIKPHQDKDVRYLIQLMAKEIPQTTIYTHLGWRKIGDLWVYLHAGGAVGSETVEIEISDRLRRYNLPGETGDVKDALKASLSLLELGPKKIVYPLMALIFLAPLSEAFRQAGIEPSLLTYIWGTTGSLKSTLIALFLSHFGNFDAKGLPASFRDTPNSIEKLAFLAKDTVLPVDDLYPARDPRERTKLEGVLEHLSRNQGDRTGKGRMKADTSLREGLPPRGLALCSGEVMPLIGSSLARGFVLRLQKGDINQEKLTQSQAQKDLLSHIMRGYLEWLAPQMDALPPQLEEAFTHTRKEAAEKATIKTRHTRLNESISHLHIGLNSFFSFAVSEGAIVQEEAVRILQEAWEVFNQIADDQALQEETGDPSKKIAEASLELEAQRRIYWADMDDTPGILDGAVKVGWKNEERGIYYTNLGALFREVNQHLKGQEEYISISKANFIEFLDRNGFLVEKDKEKNQKTIRITDNPGTTKTIKAYAISAKFFKTMEGEE